MSSGKLTREDVAFLTKGALKGLTGILALSTLAAFSGHWLSPFDNLTHFRPQMACTLILLLALLLLVREKRWILVAGVSLLLNVSQLWSITFGAQSPPDSGQTFRLVSINVLKASEAHEKVRGFMTSSDADVILLMEVNQRWLDAVAPDTNAYPYRVEAPRDDNFGIACYSRLPLTETSLEYFGAARVPTIVGQLHIGDRQATFVGTHPIPPHLMEAPERNEQLQLLGEYLAKREGPEIVIGDLNTTPWNSHFRQLQRAANLHDSSAGRGYQPTWPANWMAKVRRRPGTGSQGIWPIESRLFKIPIDHCLHSPEITTIDRQVGPYVGSDHLPIVVDLSL